MQLASGQNELRPHATVDVDTEHLQTLAAVGASAAAGIAVWIIDIRLDGAAIARLNVCHAVADSHDLHAEFMPENPRIGYKRHLAQISAYIGAANANAMDTHESFARAGRSRLRKIDASEGFWRLQLERVHG